MAKDKMMQQASWEKKKDKLDKKKDRDRGAIRSMEKADKRSHKEFLVVKNKVQKEEKGWSRINLLRGLVSTLVVGLYAAAMLLTHDDESSFVVANPMVLTGLLLVVLTIVCFAGAGWQAELEAAQEAQEAANLIKNTLEKKEAEKEKEKQRAEWRVLQLQQVKERQQRFAEEEKATLLQAKELARELRRRREERQAAEAEAAKSADNSERDAYGWTSKQLDQLRESVVAYPENWSHARKKRWEMIAAEVGGHDARTCEATMARLDEEVRAAVSRAKADKAEDKGRQESTKAKNAASSCAQTVQDDFDWLGDDDATTDMGAFDDSDDEDDDDEEQEEFQQERMAIEVEPERKGTEIRLDGIKEMQGCATVQVELLHLQLSCADCRTSTRVYLSGADEDSSDAKLWCEGCSGLMSARLRPALLHRESNRLCYVDCMRCNVTDVLPSVLMSECDSCGGYNVHKQEFARNKVISGACFKCHAKYGFGAESIHIEEITPCHPGSGTGQRQQKGKDGDDDPMEEIAEELRYLRKKARSDPRQQLIVLGRPLPQMGACKHFKKSYKWYRFTCCGRAFPCPQCHIESNCPAAALGAHAARMICGKCSMEQSYSPSRPCEKCNFAMIAKGSSHWDDGAGTRNLTTMSTKDAKKFKGGLKQGTSKFKTSSSKADRVGVKAKKAREHAQKFGKDG